MNWKILQQRTWLNLMGAVILVVGLTGAGLIFQSAGNAPYGALGYDVVDGASYPIMPEHSKMYRHNLEVYGGKFSVVMDDFRRWFIGLWQGKSLAVIIGCATIMISAWFFYVANYSKRPWKLDIPEENDPEKPG